ncbi:MAG: PAS domain S-box protein [Syntrophaceae bacterium]|nr:PAS domain S-box protein [Syntrophaceae bacterium]
MDIQKIELPRPKDFQESILENIGIGILLTDLNGNVLAFNKAAEEMWEFRKAALMGKSFLLCLAEHERARMNRTFEYVIRTEQGIKATRVVFQNHAGTILDINCFATLCRDASGEKLGVIMWTQDISEEKKLEAEVQRADRLAALGQLSLGISHEIRTPLGTIKALATLVKEKTKSDEKSLTYLNMIVSQVDRLDKLSRELLAYAGKSNLGVASLNIAELLKKVVYLGQLNNPLKKTVIEEEIAADLPVIYGDQEMLMQAFLNLMINAMEATGDKDRIRIKAFPDDDWIVVKITDSGKGIPGDCLDRIFDPFYTTKDSGTGLGLSITHTTISKHDGHIEVASDKDNGTVFTVRLPVKRGY